ncbi:hypothetical protein [Paraburkholderia sp. SIMBA_054]|uniref:hypothetical protein n=1 Tax=Paraburkholderia sp. SIMBA_054 TaxID=3085795 RepID=UPI00397A6ADE
MKTYRTIATVAALALAGHLTSHPPFSGLPFVILPLLVWLQRRDGLGAPWYVFVFFLGVGVKIPLAVIDVGSGFALAATIWLGYAFVAALVGTPPRCVKGSLAMSSWVFAMLSLPFLGFTFVAPPLSAAGWFYPETGVLGVLLIVWCAASIVEAVRSLRVVPVLAPAAIALALNVHYLLSPPPPSSIAALSMRVPQPPDNLAKSILAGVRYAPAVRGTFQQGARTVVLPENVLGFPTAGQISILGIPDGATLVAGGVAHVPGNDAFQKGVWLLPQRVFYPAIQPIPVIEPGLRPHWSALHKVANISGNPYSLLVCFEASTSLPIYHLDYGRPIILVGNGWWDRSGIMDIEVGLAHSWARLFRSSLAISRGFPQA